MSEIAKCPLCGNSPVIFPTFDPAEYCPEATECCGAAFTTVRAWNQYAAAMELAKKHKILGDYKGFNSKVIMALAYDIAVAEHHVLEVFK